MDKLTIVSEGIDPIIMISPEGTEQTGYALQAPRLSQEAITKACLYQRPGQGEGVGSVDVSTY